MKVEIRRFYKNGRKDSVKIHDGENVSVKEFKNHWEVTYEDGDRTRWIPKNEMYNVKIWRKEMTIKEIRSLTGLSQAQFADKYNIPKSTLQCWESEGSVKHRDCPDYVKELLEFKVRYDLENKC